MSQENVCVESVGYLLEELRNPATLAAFKADVESANMFIGSLIFVQVRHVLTGLLSEHISVRCVAGVACAPRTSSVWW